MVHVFGGGGEEDHADISLVKVFESHTRQFFVEGGRKLQLNWKTDHRSSAGEKRKISTEFI